MTTDEPSVHERISASTPSSGRTQALEWFKEGGLLVVTITGLFLYVFLSVPAAIFYTRLGTSPGEVGLTYVSLLSGSTVELLAILIVLTAVFLSVAFLIALIGFYARSSVALVEMLRLERSLIKKPLEELTDEEFEDRVRSVKKAYRHLPEVTEIAGVKDPELFAEAEVAKARRIRELRQINDPTPEENAELASIQAKVINLPVHPFALSWPLTKLWIRHRGKLLATFFVVTTVIIVLPTLAFFQAGQVLEGRIYFGHNIGAFGYSADSVIVNSISLHPPPSIQALTKNELFLLGQNAQYAILYAPTTQSTIHIPITTVVITSSNDRLQYCRNIY